MERERIHEPASYRLGPDIPDIRECRTCNGETTVNCFNPRCKDGLIDDDPANVCADCNGFGYVNCEDCHGTGEDMEGR